jgi:hypothetical protein
LMRAQVNSGSNILNQFRGTVHESERLHFCVWYANVPSVAAKFSSFPPKVSLIKKVVRVELDTLELTALLCLSVLR